MLCGAALPCLLCPKTARKGRSCPADWLPRALIVCGVPNLTAAAPKKLVRAVEPDELFPALSRCAFARGDGEAAKLAVGLAHALPEGRSPSSDKQRRTLVPHGLHSQPDIDDVM